MWLPSQQVNHWCGVLHPKATGELQETTVTSLRSIHRTHEGFQVYLVSRDGPFKILPKIGCPPRLLSTIRSFRKDLKGIVYFNGSTSDPFNIQSEVKKGCVFATTLFGIFFAFFYLGFSFLLLKQVYGVSTGGIYLQTRSDWKLCNLSRLIAKSKVQMIYLRDLLFCRRCSHHRPLSRRPSYSHEPFQEGISRFWAKNQPEENVGHGSGCGLTFKHYNLGAWTGVFTWLRLPVLWLDNLWYSNSGIRTKQAHRQGCYYHF